MDARQFGSDLRKHLMTGVSYMIPFVVPGGILIAIAFAMGGIKVYETESFAADIFSWGKIAFGLMVPAMAGYIGYSIADRPGIAPGFVAGMIANEQGSGFLGGIVGGLLAGYIVQQIKKVKLPAVLRPLMAVLIIPLFGTFFVSLIMWFVLGPPVTWLNEAMTIALENLSAGSMILLGLVQGAMLAFDMGGPVNKAAYFFALGVATSAGDWGPMAANFVASMSPPMGVAIAIWLGKKKWTSLERKGVSGCVIGGLAMITEFAIPYAAADPIRVIPSLMVGSSVGAALSYVFGLSLPAPHGGFFVVFLANNPLLWILTFAIACFVTAGMLILLKPDVTEEEEEIMIAEAAVV
jgi:PTS system fructose-specific IIC component